MSKTPEPPRKANESGFSQRTVGPSVGADLGKTRLRCVMMYVVGPSQSNENVDVEQAGHGQSLRALCTSSLVIGPVPASTQKTGIPSSSLVRVRLKPSRANSDTALPRLIPFLAARARATASTSSSMVTVVRIRTSSHHATDSSRLSVIRFAVSVVGHSSLTSAWRITAASLPPNLDLNTVIPANSYSGGASFISFCIVPVRLVASNM